MNKLEKTNKKFYVTTPIYYANAPAHLGGVYTTVSADVLARLNKIQGKDVFFLTGTDEHGQKIQETAEKNKKEPKEFVDEIAQTWKEIFKKLNISNDFFIRTTNPKHEKIVQETIQELYEKGYIYKGNYESYYCVGCEQYLTENDLEDGKCPLHNKVPELKKEEAYLFKLSSFQDKLKTLIKSGKYEILPKKMRKEILTFIESGLNDVSISRLKTKISWGIELPFDNNHVTWVWPDAFWNYITGLKINNEFEKFWPADVQLMAKDIFRVHATIWPALLLALDYELPKTLFIHGYFTINGKKMSKSLGNVIDPVELLKKYPADSIRYYLMRNIPFGNDGDVSEKVIAERHNNELANKLGNLVSRIAGLSEKNGIQKPSTGNKILKKLKLDKLQKLLDNYEFDKALNEIFTFIDICNEYVQTKEPWKETCKNKKNILYELVDSIKVIAILLWPFIPQTSEKIAEQFSFNIEKGNLKQIKEPISDKIDIKKSEILFEKVEVPENKELKKNKTNKKLNKQQKINELMTNVANVSFQEWQKLDLRVAQIISAEEIKKADKLLKLELDVGKLGKRTLVAGIKKYYSIEELKGKQIIIIANLEPRKMKGVESQGMLLAAGSPEKDVCVLLTPDKNKKIQNGEKIS
ncbi:MAG: methionine--tRNA ligase [Nanoarchaeota archaeon]